MPCRPSKTGRIRAASDIKLAVGPETEGLRLPCRVGIYWCDALRLTFPKLSEAQVEGLGNCPVTKGDLGSLKELGLFGSVLLLRAYVELMVNDVPQPFPLSKNPG